MKRIIVLSIALVITITVSVVVFTNRKPADLTIVFPELSVAQREFILPLCNGYKEKTSGSVSYEFKKSSEIYKDLRSENPSSDLYYVIDNFQLSQIKEEISLSDITLKKSDGVPDIFLRDEKFIPISWYPWGVYYNKALFSELNLAVPETWKDFLLLCEDIKEGDLIPLSLMSKVKWPSTVWFDYIDILINGEDFHGDLLAGNIPFKDERVKSVFSEILNLHKNGYIHMESESFEWQSLIKAMEEEMTLMQLSGSFFYENSSENLKENLGWFSFPEVKTLVASSSGFISPAGEKNQRAVRKFLTFVLSEEGQGIMQRNSDLIAVNSSVSEKLGRDDLDAAIAKLKQYDSIIPVFERNTHEKLLNSFKSAINLLYSVADENQLNQLLENLEEYRLSNIKQSNLKK